MECLLYQSPLRHALETPHPPIRSGPIILLLGQASPISPVQILVLHIEKDVLSRAAQLRPLDVAPPRVSAAVHIRLEGNVLFVAAATPVDLEHKQVRLAVTRQLRSEVPVWANLLKLEADAGRASVRRDSDVLCARLKGLLAEAVVGFGAGVDGDARLRQVGAQILLPCARAREPVPAVGREVALAELLVALREHGRIEGLVVALVFRAHVPRPPARVQQLPARFETHSAPGMAGDVGGRERCVGTGYVVAHA